MRRRLLILPCVALVDAYLPSPHAGFHQRRRFPSQLPQRLQSNRVPEDTNDVQSLMRALGTSPRRIFLSILSGTGIALSGNFLGITSTLLATISEDTVEKSGLDLYFPRGEYKRCRSSLYTFVVPSEWVADTFVELAKAQRNVQPLELQMKSQRRGGSTTLPDAAYGPPGRLNGKGVSESGDTNVSVIVTDGMRNFSLQTLGGPSEAANKLLQLSIAPEGSGRIATLVSAIEDTSRKVYQLEFNVDRGTRGVPIKNISVIAATPQGDKLITLSVVAPLQLWETEQYLLENVERLHQVFT